MNYDINNNPCKECTKRKIGCHGKCKEYQEWRKAYDGHNEQMREKRRMRNIGYLGVHYKSPSKCKGGKE